MWYRQGNWQTNCSITSVIHGFTFPVDPDKCLLVNFTNFNLKQSQEVYCNEVEIRYCYYN